MKNPAKLDDSLYGRFAAVPGFHDFLLDARCLAGIASKPGWPDKDGNPTYPSAKAIGLKQWGDAQLIAGFISIAAETSFPTPGIDTDDSGIILLSWVFAENRRLDLRLRSSLNKADYRWSYMRDGVLTGPLESDKPDEVIACLRSLARA